MDQQQHQPQPEPSEDSAPGFSNSLPEGTEAGYGGHSEGPHVQPDTAEEERPFKLVAAAVEQPEDEALELADRAPEHSEEESLELPDGLPEQPEADPLELTQTVLEQPLIEESAAAADGTEEEQPSTPEESREEQDRREEGRIPVYFETEVRCLGEPYRATIRDLSRWGALAECEDELKVRSYIYVVLPGVGSLPARVSWVQDGRFGANLLEPISDEHFERLVRILPKAPVGQAA